MEKGSAMLWNVGIVQVDLRDSRGVAMAEALQRAGWQSVLLVGCTLYMTKKEN